MQAHLNTGLKTMNTSALRLAVIDYGAGNITSLTHCLRRLGYQPVVTQDPELVLKADKIIFPGVGSAAYAMRALQTLHLDQVLTQTQKPIFGICVGMQVLCTHSEEEDTPCLGIFQIPIKKFTPNAQEKVPHMGWNRLYLQGSRPDLNAFQDQYMYFVHSYYAPVFENTVLSCDYSHTFSAAVSYQNYFATQFHPEKSGPLGAQLLNWWLAH